MTLPVLIGLSQLADGLTFLMVVNRVGISNEINPIARWLMNDYGALAIIGYKAFFATIIVLLAYKVRHRRFLLSALICVGLLGAISNTLSFVTL